MGDLADIPSKVGQRPGLKASQWVLLVLMTGLLTAMSWGANYIHMGDVRGLDVQAEFYGYRGVDLDGEYMYSMGRPMAYRVRIKNRGQVTFSDIALQSSLHSDGAVCELTDMPPGSRLPGNALSPRHTISLAPGETYEYEALYEIPSDLCPSSGNLRVRVQFPQRGRTNATTLLAPVHYQFD